VRALFFDVGGTLLRPWPSVGAIYASVANRHGIPADANNMERAFRESWTTLKRPGLTVSSKDWWRKVVYRALGQENQNCFEELYEIFAHADAWQVFPDVEETLREARRRGLHVGIISNWDERLRPLLEELGLVRYFNSITISCEVGVEKPGAEIFQSALRVTDIAAGQAVHVGDNDTADVQGAEAIGMTGVLLNRSEGEGAGLRDLRDLWDRIAIA
jgi:REG-2-like HAD superfamily hydrolase